MDCAHGLPRDARSLVNEPHQVLHGVGKRRIVNEIQPNSVYRYALRVIQWVNKLEGGKEVQN